jgi:hypothetical protein
MTVKDYLIQQVRDEIDDLLNRTHKPEIDPLIDAIWVFSGPGTITEPLKEGDEYWRKWMDRHRIIYGITLVKEITKKRIGKMTDEVTTKDIENQGPYFIYNGTKEENEALRKVLFSGLSLIPKEKIIIIDSFYDNGGKEDIKNTLDQIHSFSQANLEEKKILKNKIALVSHAQHFPRILRYINMYKPFPEYIQLEVFSLKPPAKYSEEFTEEEAEKVWDYFLNGDLSFAPAAVD